MRVVLLFVVYCCSLLAVCCFLLLNVCVLLFIRRLHVCWLLLCVAYCWLLRVMCLLFGACVSALV